MKSFCLLLVVLFAGSFTACSDSQNPVCAPCKLVYLDGGYPTKTEEEMARVWIASPSITSVEIEEGCALTNEAKHCWPEAKQVIRLTIQKRMEIYDFETGILKKRDLDLQWEAPENDSRFCRSDAPSRSFIVKYAENDSEYFRANIFCQNENSITFEERIGPGADGIAVSHWSPGDCDGIPATGGE